MPVISVNNVSLKRRLVQVNLEISQGDIWHVIGANGAGKSTLLQCLAGLVEPCSGDICLRGQNLVTVILDDIRCFVSQHYPIDFNLSVREVLQFYNGNSDIHSELDIALNISDLIERNILSLSGGELQRVHLYRNLAQVYQAMHRGEAVVILDEPTQQLDPAYQVRVLELCQWISSLDNIVIVSHHDVNQTYHYATHVLMLKAGSILASGKCDQEINEDVLSELYDQSFVDINAIRDSQKYFIARNDFR